MAEKIAEIFCIVIVAAAAVFGFWFENIAGSDDDTIDENTIDDDAKASGKGH